MRAITKKVRSRDQKGRFIKVRKNGEHRIDAQSSMNVPVRYSRIIQPQAAYRWLAPGIAAFTPRYIETTLNGALAGDHVAQWQLFNMMLDTWPVLAACQQELLYGVIRRDLVFDPYAAEDEKATPEAIDREKLVTTAIHSMVPDPTRDDNAIDGTIKDLMDAWFRGTSLLEIMWQVVDIPNQGSIRAPLSTFWVHPQNYKFNEEGVLGLVLERQKAPVPIPPNKFLVAIHKVHSGSALGGALLRPLAWWWCATNFTSDWLLNLAQVFGLPFRWANYAASSPDQTVNAICNMLQNMGSAGWAAFPEGTTLELKEASMGSGGHTPQGDLLDRADSYARLTILGQTLTGQTIASGRGGQSFGTVEAQLKQDRLDAACAFVAGIINQQLIPAILDLNYGETSDPPKCRFLQEAEGTYQDAQRDQILTGLDVPIPLSHIRHKYNIPEPTGDEPVTMPAAKPVAPSSVSPGPIGTRPIGQSPKEPPRNPKKAEVQAGDLPGHPFRGNQWTEGQPIQPGTKVKFHSGEYKGAMGTVRSIIQKRYSKEETMHHVDIEFPNGVKFNRTPLSEKHIKEHSTPEEKIQAGDLLGHPFRGNQYTSGGMAEELSPEWKDIHEQARKAARLDWRSGDPTRAITATPGPGAPFSNIRKQWNLAYEQEVNKILDERKKGGSHYQSPLLWSKLEQLNVIKDDAVFARELTKLAEEIHHA